MTEAPLDLDLAQFISGLLRVICEARREDSVVSWQLLAARKSYHVGKQPFEIVVNTY